VARRKPASGGPPFSDPISAEERFLAGIVARLYRMLLGRAADPGGLAAMMARVRGGLPFVTLVTEALQSDEFRARHPDGVRTAADVDALFEAAYGRHPPDADRGSAVGAYAALVLTAAERAAPSRLSGIFYPEGIDPLDGPGYRLWRRDYPALDALAVGRVAGPEPGDGKPEIAVSVVLIGGWRPGGLGATLESLRTQICDGFEVVAAGAVRFCAAVTRRIPDAATAVSRQTGFATAFNAALPSCRGRFVLVLRPGMRLAPDAVCHIARAARDMPDAAALLLDHDRVDSTGLHQAPTMHAGWDPDAALCRTDWATGLALRTSLAAGAGDARGAFGASQLDLAMRVLDAAGHGRVHAVQLPLLHVPIARSSLGRLPQQMTDALLTRAWARRVGDGPGAPRVIRSKGVTTPRVLYPVPKRPPVVSVVIPTRDRLDLLRQCVDGLLNRTSYEALEILIVDNRSEEAETLAYLEQLGHQPRARVIRYDMDFNWGAMNNAGVRESQGEIVLLLNNDTDVVSPDWLHEVVSQSLRPEVGVIGAKLLYHDRTIQHAGLTLGPDGHAFHRFRHVPGDHAGYRDELVTVRNVSAVTGACLAMRRAVFDEVGGIEEQNLAVTWSDVDLCYRVRAAGYRVICTPFAQLFHLELATRGKDDTPERAARAERERQFMMRKWPGLSNEDPFFNVSFRLDEDATRLACPPRFDRMADTQETTE
jgi:O-antigen biosynthesis protein